MNARLVFIDESGLLMAPLLRRTWAPRGCTPVFYQKTRSHRKVSAIAALSLAPVYQRVGLYFSLHKDSNITAHLVVRFLRALRRQVQRPMLILWDRLGTHRALVVKRWLRRQSKVHVDFFPPYAPELNPVEPLWGYLKGNPLANWAPKEVRDLALKARYHADQIRSDRNLLRSFPRSTPLFSCPR